MTGKTAGAIGSLGSALGGLDGKVGQAVGAFSKFAGALAVGGPVGLAIAGITSLIATFSKMSEEAEKAKQAQLKAFSDNLLKGVDAYGKNLDTVIGKLDKLATAQHKAAQSTIALNGAMTDKSVAQRQLDAINEAENAEAGERGIIAAQAGIDIARMRGENSVQAADINAADAKKRLDATNGAIGAVDTELRQLKSHIQVLDGLTRAYQETARKSEYGDDRAVSKAHSSYMALQKANKKLAELEEKRAGLIDTQTNQSRELAAAEEKAATARINADAENAKARAALKAAEEKAWEDEEKEREESIKASLAEAAAAAERAAKMKEEARAEAQLRQTIEDHDKHEKELDKATQELEAAKLDYAYRLKRAEIATANLDWRNGSIPTDQIIGNGMNGQSRYGARNNASIHDAAYNERVKAGYARNAQSQGYGLSARDAKELARLEMKGDDISDYDRKRRAALRERDPEFQAEKAQRAKEKAAKELEAKQAAKENAEKQLQKDVADIAKLMQQLGLK